MPPAVNTFTVTIADAHSHSVIQSAIPANSKLDAALSVLQAAGDELQSGGPFSALLTADNWTITITQP